MLITEFIDTAEKFFEEVLHEKCRIITIIKEEDKWKVVCEVIVDPEYTTRKGLGDIVEIYNVYLNDKREIIGYEIKETKKRASISN